MHFTDGKTIKASALELGLNYSTAKFIVKQFKLNKSVTVKNEPIQKKTKVICEPPAPPKDKRKIAKRDNGIIKAAVGEKRPLNKRLSSKCRLLSSEHMEVNQGADVKTDKL